MVNWFINKNDIIAKTATAAMGELETLLSIDTQSQTANYWIDSTHNIFAFVNDNGGGDRWIEIHFELYDGDGEIIGDIDVLNTDDINRAELFSIVKTIVDRYFHE